MIRRPVIVLTVLAIAAASTAANAQSTVVPSTGDAGSNPMLAMCSGLLAQGVGTVSGDKAKLCSCLVRETSAKLSTADMEAYSQASLNSQTPPQDVLDKVMAIATGCLQESQQSPHLIAK